MTKYSDQALPGAQFFFAERLAKIRDNDELVGLAPFAKERATQTPSAARELRGGKEATRFADKAIRQADRVGGAPEETFAGKAEDLLAGTIDQAQRALVVEGKDRD